MMRSFFYKILSMFLMILICSTQCLASQVMHNDGYEDELSLWFMSTGKSDCILIQCGVHAFLVDTGLADSTPTMFGVLNASGVKQLDAVFLTHIHKDHIGGLESLLQYIPVETVYRPAISDNDKDGENKIDTIAEEAGKQTTLLRAGDTITLTENASFTVLAPITYNALEENDNSLVMMLDFYGTRVLLTGDQLFAEEKTVIRSGYDLSADILKVAHHGKTDASSEAFLKEVSPKYAVILTDRSVKPNTANPETLNALKNVGAECFVTDETKWGVRFTIRPEKEISIDYPEQPAVAEQNIVCLLDRDDQCLTIKNAGETRAVLGDYILYSEKKDRTYVFPEETVLEPGASLTLTGTKGDGTLIWPETKKPFPGEGEGGVFLYDCFGRLITGID